MISFTPSDEQQLMIETVRRYATERMRPAAMANLLGDVWERGEPRWDQALSLPGVRLHLYGKAEPRPGRKMGHLTALADTADEARRRVLEARSRL